MTEFIASHWLVILAIVALLFGGEKIPEVMRRIGESIKNRKGPRGGPPTHPLPVTGTVETSKRKRPSEKDR
jgi:TatA/E family protein of Tat protein translocase